MKKALAILIALLGVGGAYFYITQNDTEQKVHYLTEEVKQGKIDKSVLATGSVRAYQRVKVGVQVTGELKAIYVQLGEKVRKGQLVAELASVNQRNSLNTAQAQLAANELQLKARQVALEVAESAYQRLAKLYAQKSASLNELENAKNTLALAKANLEETKAQIKISQIAVETAKTNLGYTQIYSPIDGVVVSIPVSIGQTLNAMQSSPTVLQVADVSKVLIKLEIAEGDITQIKSGQSVSFTTLADPNRTYQGKIESIDPALTTLTDDSYTESSGNNSAVYYYANVVIENTDQQLRIGMTTQNRVIIAEKNDVLVVPTSSLKRQGKETFVEVLENGQAVKKGVKTGLTDSLNTEIVEGLQAGEQIITTQRKANEANNPQMRMPRF